MPRCRKDADSRARSSATSSPPRTSRSARWRLRLRRSLGRSPPPRWPARAYRVLERPAAGGRPLAPPACRRSTCAPARRSTRSRPRTCPRRAACSEFYFRLSEIVRGYLGERYGFEALECTSPELLARAAQAAHARAPADGARCASSPSRDLVKFAKAEVRRRACAAVARLRLRSSSRPRPARAAPSQRPRARVPPATSRFIAPGALVLLLVPGRCWYLAWRERRRRAVLRFSAAARASPQQGRGLRAYLLPLLPAAAHGRGGRSR